jgi:hypothetical protein
LAGTGLHRILNKLAYGGYRVFDGPEKNFNVMKLGPLKIRHSEFIFSYRKGEDLGGLLELLHRRDGAYLLRRLDLDIVSLDHLPLRRLVTLVDSFENVFTFDIMARHLCKLIYDLA